MNEIFTPEQLKEEAYKCSKCALCKQVCPAYQRTKNEMLLAKGRCIIINGIFSGKVKLNKKFINTFEECKDCNKCRDCCPSSIDMAKIAEGMIRYYYQIHKIQKCIGEYLYKISSGKFGIKL